MSEKQSFLQIRTANNISIEQIAEIAKVPEADVYSIEAGVFYSRAIIDRVLAALSTLTGKTYTLENVEGVHPQTESQQESAYNYTTITMYDLRTLKGVITGYMGFLKSVSTPDKKETVNCLQRVYDRLPLRTESNELLYFPYEERRAILEAVVGFKLLLVIVFPPTTYRNEALADVERLYQCFLSARSLPPT